MCIGVHTHPPSRGAGISVERVAVIKATMMVTLGAERWRNWGSTTQRRDVRIAVVGPAPQSRLVIDAP